MLIFVCFLVFMIGASVFSFLNVVVYRLPRKMNYISGRSMCTSCGRELKPWHMVPVFSWLLLRGKCAYCGEKISFRYTFMELLGGAAALLSVWQCTGFSVMNIACLPLLKSLLVFAVLGTLTTVAFIDADTMEIPNGLVIILAALGAASYFLYPETGIISRLIGAVCISVPMLLLALVIDGAFGGGDIKLMAAAGLFLGWKLTLTAMFFALLTGGAYAVYLLISGKKGRKEHFAFGPFLCVGIALAWFCGSAILRWYLGLFSF